MSKFYQCIKAWKRHSLNDIIPEHEYNKLPHEIKKNGNFVEFKASPTQVVNAHIPKSDDIVTFDVPIQTDILSLGHKKTKKE